MDIAPGLGEDAVVWKKPLQLLGMRESGEMSESGAG